MINRRDFLRLGSAFTGAAALSGLASSLKEATGQATSRPGVIIIVFDAMSATNLSLYGYPRKTTPSLERFAERATVYRQHYSAANFTTPGTATLLTGLYPWTHRAINEGGLIRRDLTKQNLFEAFGTDFHRLAFSQNFWPNYFIGQFQKDIDDFLAPAAFGFVEPTTGDIFRGDLVDGFRAFDDFLFKDGAPPGSLVFGTAEKAYTALTQPPEESYSSGIPLAKVFDGLERTIENLRAPWLAYLHLLPPHAPYRASVKFRGQFEDGWVPTRKSSHRLVDPRTHHSYASLNEARRRYDEYIANLDAEFGRLLDGLERRGVLKSSYLAVTSDHGEFFERGEEGHITPLLYDPVVRVPLLISAPGQDAREDIEIPTSSVDLLPTLTLAAGGAAPDWGEGQSLPGLGGPSEPDRSIFMMDAKENHSRAAMDRASFAMRKRQYKLHLFRGYEQYRVRDKFELYDLENDPEELEDLYTETSMLHRELRDELLAKVDSPLTAPIG
jgi:arylsulfatase A-like enzyme